MKKLAVVLAIVAAIGFTTMKSEATPAWYTCNLTSVAVYGNGSVYFEANGTADIGGAAWTGWAAAPADATLCNRMLACMLTGVSIGCQVKLYIDPVASLYPSVVSMYLLP